MNFKEALHKAILGYKVARDDMGDNNYLFYNFNGFELNKGKFYITDEDKAADWYVVDADEIQPHPKFVQTVWDIDLAASEMVEQIPISINKDKVAWPMLSQ